MHYNCNRFLSFTFLPQSVANAALARLEGSKTAGRDYELSDVRDLRRACQVGVGVLERRMREHSSNLDRRNLLQDRSTEHVYRLVSDIEAGCGWVWVGGWLGGTKH